MCATDSCQKSLVIRLEERYSAEMKTPHFSRMLIIFLTMISMNSTNCPADDSQTMAVINDPRIDESSGLAISRNHPRCVWIHNDSGAKPVLYLVGYDGETKAVVKVLKADAIDWEDMCSFEINGQAWLLIADVGDNDKKRSAKKHVCKLYLMKEPQVPQANGLPTISWPVVSTISFEYEDGSHNCESVAVDTHLMEILLLTKAKPQKSGLYRLPLKLDEPNQSLTAQRFASPFVPYATGMDVSPDNSTLAICTLLNGLIVKRTPNQSWQEACSGTPIPMMLPPRRQGETICFESDNKHLLLNSEKTKQPLYRIPVPETK